MHKHIDMHMLHTYICLYMNRPETDVNICCSHDTILMIINWLKFCHISSPADQLVTRDRRVPVSGERVDEFLAGTGSGAIGRKINCGRSHSDTRKPGSISAAPTRSEGCLSTAANRLETPCNHGGMLSPGVDSVFYEDHRMLFCGVDQPEHSNHSSLSQGYGSLSESETCCWQAESDSPSIRTRSVSSVTMRAEDRRKVWSKTSSKVQTLDTVSPAKGSNRRDRATTDASFSRTGTWPTDPYCHGVQDGKLNTSSGLIIPPTLSPSLPISILVSHVVAYIRCSRCQFQYCVLTLLIHAYGF